MSSTFCNKPLEYLHTNIMDSKIYKTVNRCWNLRTLLSKFGLRVKSQPKSNLSLNQILKSYPCLVSCPWWAGDKPLNTGIPPLTQTRTRLWRTDLSLLTENSLNRKCEKKNLIKCKGTLQHSSSKFWENNSPSPYTRSTYK